MLRHYLLLAFRNFKRYKTSFLINWVGLSTGLASALLIYLWVNDELGIDKFHQKDAQLYQVMRNVHSPDNIMTFDGTPGLLAGSLAAEMPEVEMAVADRPTLNGNGILSVADQHIMANEHYVSQGFFDMFSYTLIQGSRDEVLKDKYSIAISDELANKLFQTTEGIIGQTVEWNLNNFSGSYSVSGVFRKTPNNSSEQFDLLFNFELFLEKLPHFLNWDNNNPATYIVLKPGTDVDVFQEKLDGFIKTKLPTTNSTLFLRKYSDKYLYDQYENGEPAGGRIAYVRLFSMVAIFILVIACINFMNLSTAQASRKMKEIGVKKAIGASRQKLILQFLSESLVIAFLSLVLSVILVALFLPQFNQITGKNLLPVLNAELVLAVTSITLLTGLLAGSYPALYLSGFRPSNILKGASHSSGSDIWTRKGLVIFQFAISAILMVSIMVVSEKLSFIQNKNLGYSKDQVIYFTNGGNLLDSYDAFLNRLDQIPGVVKASSFANNLTGSYGATSGIGWDGKDPEERIEFGNLEVGYDLVEVLNIEVQAGRTFSRQYNNEASKIIFNEAAIATMGMKDPIGKMITLWGEEKQIIGVVKNFHFESLYEDIKPCFLRLHPASSTTLVKIRKDTESETVAQLGEVYSEFTEGLPFDYQFLDNDYVALYSSEQRVSLLSRYFGVLAILISGLGLFGLASFTTERRLKEIGIRKILGASEFGIVRLLSSDFTKLVVISLLVALPVSYWIAGSWLNSFAYRTNIQLWFFGAASLLALLVAWLAVGLQTIKAAQVNPVQCLQDD